MTLLITICKAVGLIICILSGGWLFSEWQRHHWIIGALIGLVTLFGSFYLGESLYNDLVTLDDDKPTSNLQTIPSEPPSIFRIEIARLAKREQAIRLSAGVTTRLHRLLEKYRLYVSETKTDENYPFLLLIGDFESRSEAEAICKEMMERFDIGCQQILAEGDSPTPRNRDSLPSFDFN